MRRLLLPALAATLTLVLAAPAGATHESTISFSYRTYANNVRVRAPLVGNWQLGVARQHGSGAFTSSSLAGAIVGTNDPLLARYPATFLRAQVVGYRFFQAAHGAYTKLTLTIEVTRSSEPNCDPGTRGTLVLYDSDQKLANGETSDYVTVRWPARSCLGYVQGWTNEDGGERTRPAYGGAPHGGQWAIVEISPR
jgi:hypothetical protein